MKCLSLLAPQPSLLILKTTTAGFFPLTPSTLSNSGTSDDDDIPSAMEEIQYYGGNSLEVESKDPCPKLGLPHTSLATQILEKSFLSGPLSDLWSDQRTMIGSKMWLLPIGCMRG